MITVFKKNATVIIDGISHNAEVHEVRCLSTDTKPTNVTNGSHCLEIDTGDEYLFNGTANEWEEYTPAGGGGGGSSLPSAYGEDF